MTRDDLMLYEIALHTRGYAYVKQRQIETYDSSLSRHKDNGLLLQETQTKLQKYISVTDRCRREQLIKNIDYTSFITSTTSDDWYIVSVDACVMTTAKTAEPTEEAEFEEDSYKCETRLDDLEVRVKLINSINVSLSVTAVEKNKNENGTFAETKIPPIIFPTFSGKYEQFSNFKSRFDDLITTNEQLTQSQKLYYLNSCLSNEVKEFASTSDTFSSLYEALESRYNKRLIVDIHVQQILNFKKIERENLKEIREMIDCIKKNLRVLKLLNYEQNNLFNVFLLNIMLKKLDNESRKNFELTLKAKDVPTYDEFIAFLERETILLSIDKNCIVET
ncbi:uncharacterized protein TNCV_1196341 [Trichonephila clavipes]|uniref:Uncharacterized protein n=1 Tax=Trichonephila clavipes TaxID=2585209 RepID=A0A8X6RZ59_TRICX|nr:uncharacterized protein TNCV_1196341 [Trichonephila clavipes]